VRMFFSSFSNNVLFWRHFVLKTIIKDFNYYSVQAVLIIQKKFWQGDFALFFSFSFFHCSQNNFSQLKTDKQFKKSNINSNNIYNIH